MVGLVSKETVSAYIVENKTRQNIFLDGCFLITTSCNHGLKFF